MMEIMRLSFTNYLIQVDFSASAKVLGGVVLEDNEFASSFAFLMSSAGNKNL
jgi:hypothetical protein